ncbi:MAG: hypothetical protein JNM98_04340 [Rhodocyclaceae bacterium]|nr:hypothetical protein [Rhodocyclaceae bacterium]
MAEHGNMRPPGHLDPNRLPEIAADVAEIPDLQQVLLERHPDLKMADRVAHQYQIAGSPVELCLDQSLPAELDGVGLFLPGTRHCGVGRVSTGLGCPHAESNPDFLGLMLAFRTAAGARVDFLAINDPAAPADNHRAFVAVLHAAAQSTGAQLPFSGALGDTRGAHLVAEQGVFVRALTARVGPLKAAAMYAHVVKQTLHVVHSSTAWQSYWTGVVEAGGVLGKFTLVPEIDDNHAPGLHPPEYHLSRDWHRRQAQADIDFRLYWIAYLNEELTPLVELGRPWQEAHRQSVGLVRFPRRDAADAQTALWEALAAEMGANPGNWVRNKDDSLHLAATEFEAARVLAYRASQQGRAAIDPALYASVFENGQIGDDLAAQLQRRRADKLAAGHVDCAPRVEG